MENSYKENFKSYTEWGTVIVRSNKTPLDRTSIFGSYEDALKYAQGDGSDVNKLGKTSYIGQFLSVHEKGSVEMYQIIGDDTKQPIERKLRKVINEDELEQVVDIIQKIDEVTSVALNDLNNRVNYNKDRLIKQVGSEFDCKNGTLTLATEDETKTITINLTSDYGTF